MAVLKDTKCNISKSIRNNFEPFKKPKYIEGMIIGNDLDSLLSSCFLKKIYGWDIKAIYDYKSLWVTSHESNFLKKLVKGKFIGVDLDIYNENIPSIGHHILAFDSFDRIEGHKLSLNPNLIRGIYYNEFRRKYPLSTIHFLLWIFEHTSIKRDTEDLIWLSDSSYINSQSHRFRNNVSEWILNFFQGIFFEKFNEVNNLNFENRINDSLLPLIKASGLETDRGYVKSLHLGIKGCQCQWKNPNYERDNILSMYDKIQSITNWEIPSFPEYFEIIKGNRRSFSLKRFINEEITLDDFLAEKKVFSYVFPNKSSINYTTNILK